MQKEKKQNTNRAFDEMLKHALKRLEGKAPEEIEKKTGICFDRRRQIFYLNSMGIFIEIQYPDFSVRPVLDEWHHLLVLHYLDLADGSELSGRLMTFGELPDGMVRGGGFDRHTEQEISEKIGHCSPKSVKEACAVLGGRLCMSNADICAVFDFFPRYPVTFKLWFADEEIPGSGRLFLDRSAEHFLSVEDAVTAGTLLLENLIRLIQNCEK